MKKIKWWVIPLVLNLVFLSCTVGWSFIPKNTGQEYLTIVNYLVANMSLRGEMTLAVWWSGVLMFASGLTCYEIASRSSGNTFAAWLFFAVVLVGFGVDEMASIHERLLQDWKVIIILMLAGGVGALGALWTLSQKAETRLNALFLLLGIGLMASAAPQEYLEHSIKWNEFSRPKLFWNLRLGIEEGSEIFGALLCLIGAVSRRRETSEIDRAVASIPNPINMGGVLYVAVTLLLAHIAIVATISGRVEIGNRGNPFVVYPTLVFLASSALNVWSGYHAKSIGRGVAEQAVLILMSLFAFYFLSESTSLFGSLRADILRFSFLVFVSSYFFSRYIIGSKKGYGYWGMFLGYSLIAASFFVNSVAADYILFGCLSLLVFSMELASANEPSTGTEAATSWTISPNRASR